MHCNCDIKLTGASFVIASIFVPINFLSLCPSNVRFIEELLSPASTEFALVIFLVINTLDRSGDNRLSWQPSCVNILQFPAFDSADSVF